MVGGTKRKAGSPSAQSKQATLDAGAAAGGRPRKSARVVEEEDEGKGKEQVKIHPFFLMNRAAQSNGSSKTSSSSSSSSGDAMDVESQEQSEGEKSPVSTSPAKKKALELYSPKRGAAPDEHKVIENDILPEEDDDEVFIPKEEEEDSDDHLLDLDEEEEEKSDEERKKKQAEVEKKKVQAAANAEDQSKLTLDGNVVPAKLDLASAKFDPLAFAQSQLASVPANSSSTKSMPYLILASAFNDIEKSSGKGSALRAITVMSNVFRTLIASIAKGWTDPQDLLSAVYLSTNRLAPPYEGLELGVGEQVLLKSIAAATGTSLEWLKKSYSSVGDLGLVAQNSRSTQRTLAFGGVSTQKPKTVLTIDHVFKTFKSIAQEQGHSSQNKKVDKIRSLLVTAREMEPQFLIRSLQGKMRIGMGEKSMVSALARAFVLTPSPGSQEERDKVTTSNQDARIASATETLKQVFSEVPIYDVLIPAALKHGIGDLHQHCSLTAGLPLHPMLAQPTKGVSEVLDRFQNQRFTCEYKYDGERAQIHMTPDGVMKIYSRNLEDNTRKYPDVIQNVPHATKEGTKSFILDCEVVAFDKATNKLLPFQVLSTRQRKVVDLDKIKVFVVVFAFDLLYLNGEALVYRPLQERRELLRSAFQEVEGEFSFAKGLDTSDVEDIQTFLNTAVQNQCEGLMVKSLEKSSEYTPSRRSYSWLKIKKDYLKGMTDSFDLVPIGAYLGRGKRTGVYGAYLLACYDDENEEYQSVCKIGTGFTDADLEKFSTALKSHVIKEPRPYYRVTLDNANAIPDVWFDVSQVWEVLAADISISPLYKAAVGMVDASRGLSLRFPRFIRIREDKNPEDATTSEQVAEMYRKQALANNDANGAKAGGADEDDFLF